MLLDLFPGRYPNFSLLVFLLPFLLGVSAATALAAQPASRPPNVLLVITDDQGYGDFSLHGNPHLQTPVFDRLARDGVQFERFYVSPVCAPTRASLLTGRWSLRTGVWGVTHGKEAMHSEEVTIAEALKSAGYRTGMFGKWHNGEQYPRTPSAQGFDEFLGFNNGHWNNYFDTELLRGTKLEKTKGYIVDVLTDEAIDFIERHQAQPFFCYLSYNTPHSPFQVPDRYFDKYKAMGLDDTLASVYGMCANIDDNLGRVLAALERLQLRENTIVMFLTDNGANTDRYNAGMRGRKGSVHEGGVRVPFAVQWPARLKEPQVVRTIAAHIDVYPTVLEWCGVKAPVGPKIDGISLVPLIERRSADWPDRLLFTHHVAGGRPPENGPASVRSQQYRAVLERGGAASGWQLYDMGADPGQKNDIARQHPAMVERLSSAYQAWYDDVSRGGYHRVRIPIGHEQENPVALHAPQSYFSGNIRFHANSGNSNDWLTGWTELSDRIWFEVDVVRAGRYDVVVRYAAPEANAGARIRVRNEGGSTADVRVAGSAVREVVLPHRMPSPRYQSREWKELNLGSIELRQGPATLTIEALEKPGAQVLDLKGLTLRRVR